MSEVVLANQLGVSRTPVREAIRQLESEGFVRQIPRFGTFVRRLNAEEFTKMWELREVLECYAVERATPRISEEGIKRLGELCELARNVALKVRNDGMCYDNVKTADWGGDVEFHGLIMESAENQFIVRINENYSLLTKLMTLANPPEVISALHVASHTFGDHYRIYRAIRNRNPQDAAFWMRRHLQSALEAIMKFFKEEELRRKQKKSNYKNNIDDIELYEGANSK